MSDIPATNSRPDGLNILEMLLQRIKGVEEIAAHLHGRIEHLELDAHSEHTIGGEAVMAIAAHVKNDIARLLQPPVVEQPAPAPQPEVHEVEPVEETVVQPD